MIRFSPNCSGLPNHKHFELLEMKLRAVGEPSDIYVVDVFHDANFDVSKNSPWWCTALFIDSVAVVEGNPYWERAKVYARESRDAGKRVALIGVPVRSIPSEDHSLFDRFIY